MLKIREAIVVEGRYDKNTLSQLVDTIILETTGFAIFKNQEKLSLFRRIAQARGLVILTDGDGAGFLIRNYLKGALPAGQVKHAYIPDVYGKEKRKRKKGAEGKLGVEGMRPAVLEAALRRAGATFLEESTATVSADLTKADLYACGLAGGPDSGRKRRTLLARLDLPEHLSANSLLPVLGTLYSRDALLEEIRHMEQKGLCKTHAGNREK